MKDVLRVIEFNYGGHKHYKSVLKTKMGDSRYEKMSDEDIVAGLIKVLTQRDAFRKKVGK
jgi:hypothetical protein